MHDDLIRSARTEHIEGDRLSSLPDDLIYKIISFLSIKEVIGTSVLSSRWRFIWTSTPCLNFENLTGPSISKFISNVLSHRNNQTQVSSVNLVLGRSVIDNESVGTILNCTSSHDVQQLTLTRSPGELVGHPMFYAVSLIATPTWDLPALTTLHLHHIILSDDNGSLFSKCPNLKNLSLRRCQLVEGTKVLNICHPRLCDLTLEDIRLDMEQEEYVNVAAPQLKNLSIKSCAGKHLISAPGLASLVIKVFPPWQISAPEGFPSLEWVDIFMYSPSDADAHKILCLLQQFRGAKLFILSFGILQRLASSMELMPHQAFVFPTAKILKFITKMPVKVFLEVRAQEKVSTSTEIINYKTSSCAIFPMVSHEEIKAMRDMASAQIFVENLGLLLNECKTNTNCDTNKSQMDEHGNPQVKKLSLLELQLNLGEMIELIEQSKSVALETCLMLANFKPSCRDNLRTIAWLQGNRSLFQCIDNLMINKLSASKRAVMQPNFNSLCKDAAVLTDNILEWMKTKK